MTLADVTGASLELHTHTDVLGKSKPCLDCHSFYLLHSIVTKSNVLTMVLSPPIVSLSRCVLAHRMAHWFHRNPLKATAPVSFNFYGVASSPAANKICKYERSSANRVIQTHTAFDTTQRHFGIEHLCY